MNLNPYSPFFPYLKPYRRAIIFGLLLLTVYLAISVAIPLLLKFAIDSIQAELEGRSALGAFYSDGLVGDLTLYAAIIAALGLLQWLVAVGMRWYLTGSSRWVERDIRQIYVNHLLKLSLDFFQHQKVGDLMARSTSDVEAIQRFLHHAFRMSLTGILTFVLSLGLMSWIDWQLALLALVPMPFMALMARQVGGRVHRGSRRVQEQFGAMSTCIQENLAGIRVVKAFALRQEMVERFARLNRDYVRNNCQLINIRSLFFPFTYLINGLSMLVILWLGGLRVIEGHLTLGDFVAFNAYLIRMGRPMMFLGRIIDEYQRARASLGRLEAVLDTAPQPGALEVANSGQIGGEIEFRQVRFAYEDREALRGIDLKIPAGTTLAVVGRVGAGKTTLARLLPRLLEAGPGQVCIDGVPVEQIPLRDLRAAIGYVPQDTFLFSDTIRENIDLKGQHQDEVDWAAGVAQLQADLEVLPGGLETLIGERGVTLSGGQRQRIALARAVVSDPRILILDDALASVDTRTEEKILTQLRQVMRQRTTILIAHRISTVKDADQIVVLDEGKIAECGRHDELLARQGIYADMYRRQHLSQELSEL